MKREWNSAEALHSAKSMSAPEGKECGSLDRFQHSESEVLAAMVPFVACSWAPARQFWASFQVCDPAELGPGWYRSRRSLMHFRQSLIDVLYAQPADARQLQEKLKIAAAVVILGLLRRRKGLCSDDRRSAQQKMIELLGSPPHAFEPTWAIAPQPRRMPGALIQHCRDEWKTELLRNWKRLQGDRGE